MPTGTSNTTGADRNNAAGWTQYRDQSGTIVVSPQTVNNTATLTLTPPSGAKTLVFRASTAVTYSDTSDQSNGKYLSTANLDERVPCCNRAAIYLKSTADGTVIYFRFEMS